MTKREMLNRKLQAIQYQIRQLEQDGDGDTQYAELNYFNSRCRLLKNHLCGIKRKRNTGVQWDAFVRIAKSLFGKQYITQLTYEQADVCVAFLNECVDVLNKYEEIAKGGRNK